MKRFFAMLLSILMLVELLPMSALADSRVVSDPASGGKFFTVTFTVDGRELEGETRVVEKGKRIGELPGAPKKSGKEFIGWFDGEKQVDSSFKPKKSTEPMGFLWRL